MNARVVKATSELDCFEIDFIWCIKNFSFYLTKQEFDLESPAFSIPIDGNNKWSLRLIAEKKNVGRIIKVGLFKKFDTGVTAFFRITIDYITAWNDGYGGSSHLLLYNCKMPFANFLIGECSDKSRKFKVRCHVEYVVDAEMHEREIQSMTITQDELDLHFDILLEDKTFADVVLVANDQELWAHKVILAASSSVFSAMFRHAMLENKHNRVTIPDVNFEVLKEMVRFMYSNGMRNPNVKASELLVAADKYDFQGLKSICEKEIYSSELSVENAMDIFVLANTLNAKQLESKTRQFIECNWKMVMTEEQFRPIVDSFPKLAVKIATTTL